MRIRSISAIALVSTMLVAGSGAAFAAEADSSDTQVGVGFTDYNTPGGPTDPSDPNYKPLKINWAPKQFDFGYSHAVSGATASYDADGGNKYVVVTEGRSAAGSKWALSAKLSNLTDGEGGSLTGSSVTFNTDVKAGSSTIAPDAPGGVKTKDVQTATTVGGSVLNAGSSSATRVAVDGTSTVNSAVTSTAIELSSVKLNLPAGAGSSGKTYTGNITWSLNDTL